MRWRCRWSLMVMTTRPPAPLAGALSQPQGLRRGRPSPPRHAHALQTAEQPPSALHTIRRRKPRALPKGCIELSSLAPSSPHAACLPACISCAPVRGPCPARGALEASLPAGRFRQRVRAACHALSLSCSQVAVAEAFVRVRRCGTRRGSAHLPPAARARGGGGMRTRAGSSACRAPRTWAAVVNHDPCPLVTLIAPGCIGHDPCPGTPVTHSMARQSPAPEVRQAGLQPGAVP